jgi:hypothetical protein
LRENGGAHRLVVDISDDNNMSFERRGEVVRTACNLF